MKTIQFINDSYESHPRTKTEPLYKNQVCVENPFPHIKDHLLRKTGSGLSFSDLSSTGITLRVKRYNGTLTSGRSSYYRAGASLKYRWVLRHQSTRRRIWISRSNKNFNLTSGCTTTDMAGPNSNACCCVTYHARPYPGGKVDLHVLIQEGAIGHAKCATIFKLHCMCSCRRQNTKGY